MHRAQSQYPPISLQVFRGNPRSLVREHQAQAPPAVLVQLLEVDGPPAAVDDRVIAVMPFVIDVLNGEKSLENHFRAYGFWAPSLRDYTDMRLMDMANRFGLPVLTFVDTPGAYPGIGAEERGQSEAIGRNLYEMAGLRTPIIVTVIGEGGSGGALGVAIGDVTLMLQYATYSVISPEGCASILWKSAEQAPEAAETLGITAPRLKQLGLVDKVVNEPLGGAHRDPARRPARVAGPRARPPGDLRPAQRRALRGADRGAHRPTARQRRRRPRRP